MCLFFFQAEDGIRDLVRSRGLGDVYKRQGEFFWPLTTGAELVLAAPGLERDPAGLVDAVQALSLIHI